MLIARFLLRRRGRGGELAEEKRNGVTSPDSPYPLGSVRRSAETRHKGESPRADVAPRIERDATGFKRQQGLDVKRDSVVEKSDGQCHTAALGYRRQPELDSVADGSLPLVDSQFSWLFSPSSKRSDQSFAERPLFLRAARRRSVWSQTCRIKQTVFLRG